VAGPLMESSDVVARQRRQPHDGPKVSDKQ
jgi:hypothetical protein